MKKFLCLFLTAMLLIGAVIVPIGAAELDITPPADSATGDYVAPKFIGIQTRVNNEGTDTETQDIRFVATVTNTNGNLLGIDVYANGQSYETLSGTSVYKTIDAGNKTFSAEEGKYLFVVVITGVPTNLTNVQFDVRTYIQYGEDNTEVRSYNTTFEMTNQTFQTTLTNPSPAWATQGGKGTANNPYVLTNENFVAFYDYHKNAGSNAFDENLHFSLESDVVVNDVDDIEQLDTTVSTAKVFTSAMKQLKGGSTFNGNNHTISGLYIKTTTTRAALFYQVAAGATVKNLRVTNSYFENTHTDTTNYEVGSIAGRVLGTIEYCYSDAIIRGSSGTKVVLGGIAGMSNAVGAKISNCVFAGTINGECEAMGGILGKNNSNQTVTIENCLNLGSVKGTTVGAILGKDSNKTSDTNIKNCINLAQNITYLYGGEAGLTFDTYVIEGYSSDTGTGVTQITLAEFLALTSTDLPGWYFEEGYVPSPIDGLRITIPST